MIKYYRTMDHQIHEIKQDAVLLKKGENNEGAKRFLKFLKESQEATAIRDAYGYGTAK